MSKYVQMWTACQSIKLSYYTLLNIPEAPTIGLNAFKIKNALLIS